MSQQRRQRFKGGRRSKEQTNQQAVVKIPRESTLIVLRGRPAVSMRQQHPQPVHQEYLLYGEADIGDP